MIEVILEYKRTNVDKSTGRIVTKTDIGHHTHMPLEVPYTTFEDSDFAPMLYKFAKALQDYPDANAVIQRTDRPGLVPYNLDGQTANLFRTDPVAAITSMSQPYGSPSGAVARVKKENVSTSSALRVGYDALADSFGDQVFVRYDGTRVECPCCGIWNPFSAEYTCRNPKCSVRLEFSEVSGKWAGFNTADVLATQSKRFYFPRAWNGYQPWVSWEALNEKYEQFNKEKTSCP